ncbi:MAG TPA: hypothetical protein VJ846_13675 [Sphingomicrobium sp.]|nr:hypothetical protein [Sphingomicrobium sp.]
MHDRRYMGVVEVQDVAAQSIDETCTERVQANGMTNNGRTARAGKLIEQSQASPDGELLRSPEGAREIVQD